MECAGRARIRAATALWPGAAKVALDVLSCHAVQYKAVSRVGPLYHTCHRTPSNRFLSHSNPEGLDSQGGNVCSFLSAARIQRIPYPTLSGLYSFYNALIRGLVRQQRQTNPRLINGTALRFLVASRA